MRRIFHNVSNESNKAKAICHESLSSGWWRGQLYKATVAGLHLLRVSSYYLVIGVKVRKMTHGESGSLICHGHHKGQGLWGGRANIINPTFLEPADGRALIGGH